MHTRKKIPVKTKWGTFLLEVTDRGLYSVRFPGRCHYPPTPTRCDISHLVGVQRFGKYFKDPQASFAGIKLDLTGCTPFQRKVYAALRKVPAGRVVTYAELAKRAGFPGAARAVGSAMKRNRLPIIIPCHRVVPSSVPIPINFREVEIGAVQTTLPVKNGKVWTGGIGEYSAGKKWKRLLLSHERSPIVSRCQRQKSEWVR